MCPELAAIWAEDGDGEERGYISSEEGAKDEFLHSECDEINQACEHAFRGEMGEDYQNQEAPGTGAKVSKE
jgi:hypothetical protein